MASVVRPGRAGRPPHGDDPPGAARSGTVTAGGSAAAEPLSASARACGDHASGSDSSSSSATSARMPIRVPRRPARLEPAPAGDDRDRADAVLAQVVDRGQVEAGRVDPEHGDVGLARAGGGEQVVDVDAPLEHHDAGPIAERGQRRRLPRRARRDHQDDDHVSPAGPR